MTDMPSAADLAAYRAHWAGMSFLARIPRSTLVEWLRAGRVEQFTTGQALITEGEPQVCVFLLLTGSVKIATRFAGQDALLSIRSGGDVVGELAALSTGTRSATVKVCGRDPVIACRLTRDELLSLLATDPGATLVLAQSITDKFLSAIRRRIDYTTRPPKVCLARALVELVERYGHPVGETSFVITIDLTHQELGTLVGVGESTAQRALREMRELGVVNTSGRRPMVHDLAALRAIAELPPADPGK